MMQKLILLMQCAEYGSTYNIEPYTKGFKNAEDLDCSLQDHGIVYSRR
jgi:hypothetical protein